VRRGGRLCGCGQASARVCVPAACERQCRPDARGSVSWSLYKAKYALSNHILNSMYQCPRYPARGSVPLSYTYQILCFARICGGFCFPRLSARTTTHACVHLSIHTRCIWRIHVQYVCMYVYIYVRAHLGAARLYTCVCICGGLGFRA